MTSLVRSDVSTLARGMRALAARTALASLVALVAACGGSGGGDSTSTPTPTDPGSTSTTPVTSGRVSMLVQSDNSGYGYPDSYSFTPSSLTLKLGGTVTWTNATGIVHNVTFDAADGAPADVSDNDSGASERTFAKVGTFNYHCSHHAGMSGTVTVVQ